MSIAIFKAHTFPAYGITTYEHSNPSKAYHSLSEAVNDLDMEEGPYLLQWPNSSTGYGASAIEYSNAACIENDYPGSVPSSWDHGVLTPLELFTAEDSEAAEAIMALLDHSPVYNDDDYNERVENGKWEELRLRVESSLRVVGSDLEWPDVEATVTAYNVENDWAAWPEADGPYYYLPVDDYLPLWEYIKTQHNIKG